MLDPGPASGSLLVVSLLNMRTVIIRSFQPVWSASTSTRFHRISTIKFDISWLSFLAAVGISYNDVCIDDKRDDGTYELMLERLSDKWAGEGYGTHVAFDLLEMQ
ncbi:hypothetical protein BDR07DRAFT_419233 [Suillus spraguei]|nr:hypothetical protein BDR07DRAFT_419233 [Suillus spraguei]